MNFEKYEIEVRNFLKQNYTDLKRVKVNNSERAFKGMLVTENADINNYSRSIVNKIVGEARKTISNELDNVEIGYEFGEKYKKLVQAPVFNQIQMKFAANSGPTRAQATDEREATQNFKQKSKIEQYKKSNALPIALAAGAATFVIGAPLAGLLTPMSFGTIIIVLGFAAVVVAGVVYTIVKFKDENGNVQETQLPTSTPKSTQMAAAPVRKAAPEINQQSLANLLDVRKAEAEAVLLETIKKAQRAYENLHTEYVQHV